MGAVGPLSFARVLLSSFLVLTVLAAALPASVVEEALDASSVTTVPGAIDHGAAAALVGLLPTSEAYQRANEVAQGLKAGVPTPPPTLPAAQLEVVAVLAEGAVRAAAQTSATTGTTTADRAALRAFAQGYMRGALAPVSSFADPALHPALKAQAEGAFRGVVEQVTTGEPRLAASQHEQYAQAFARESLDGLAAHASALSVAAGSPALADVSTYVAGLVKQHAQTAPTSATAQQLDALGSLSGGDARGILVGVLGQFPSGIPAPHKADVKAWLDGIARGHQGTPPWSGQGSPDLLAAYAATVAQAGVAAIRHARDDVAGPSPQARLDALSAYAAGLASGAVEHLGRQPDPRGDLADDVAAYADGLVRPAVDLILHLPASTTLDPDAVTAYANGLTGGLDDLAANGPAAGGLFARYAAGLVDAVAAFPADVKPQQVLLVEAFAEGATNRIGERLASVQRGAVTGGDAEFLDAFALGMADGAAQLARGTGPAGSPSLVANVTDGLTAGFLQSKDPAALWMDLDGYGAAVSMWFATLVPGSAFGPLANATLDGVDGASGAARDWGAEMGAAPVEWVGNKGKGLTPEAFAAKNDLLWLSAFAQETANRTLAVTLDPENPDAPRTRALLRAYVGNVAANATGIPARDAARTLAEGSVAAAAKRYADAVTEPVHWLAPDVRGTTQAADAALERLASNATTITRFANLTYARGVVTMLDAVGDGIRAGAQDARRDARGAAGNLTAAWTQGVLDAVLDAPIPAVQADLRNRATYVAALTRAAVEVSSRATRDQAAATRQYADAAVDWTLARPDDPLPDLSALPLPLVAWADATVGETLERLPPTLGKEERDAYVAYARGVAKAIRALPLPGATTWTPQQVEALTAYVGGVQSGVALVQGDVADLRNATLCQLKMSQECADGGTDPDPDPCTTDCPEPCTTDCEGDEPCASFKSCPEKAAAAYGANVASWSENVTRAGLEQMPGTAPTQDGVAAVARWAGGVLAGHGVAVNLTEPSVTPEGPRGPAWDFASARPGDVQAFAEAVAQGYAPLVQLPSEATLEGLVGLADPVQRWAQAIGQAAAGHYVGDAPGYEPALPGAPSGTRPSTLEDEAVQAWLDSLWDALPVLYRDLADTPLPNTTFLRDYGWHVDYVVLQAVAQGGIAAADETRREALAQGAALTPQTGALDAFALGLLEGANATVAQPARTDAAVLVRHLKGAAQGGVEAILHAKGAVTGPQATALQAYAAALGDPSWIPAPPTPIPVPSLSQGDAEDEEAAADESPGSGGSGDAGGEPDPRDAFLTNVQAHAQGVARAALAAPIDPLAANADAYRGALLAYAAEVQASAARLPPVSPDEGYAARLRAWAEGEARAALGNPSDPSASRLAPDPDLALGLAYLRGLTGPAPWRLLAQGGADVAAAQAAAAAGLAAACPTPDAPADCARLGEGLGEGVGRSVPDLPAPATLLALVDGAARGLADAQRPAIDPAVDASIVAGILQGLPPAAPDAGPVAAAVAEAVAQHAPRLPPGVPQPLAAALAEALSGRPAAHLDGLAHGAASSVSQDPQATAANVQARVKAFLDGSIKPAISVSDGEREAPASDLDGTPLLSALRGIVLTVVAPKADAPGTTWEVAWSGTDPAGADAKRAPLAAADGRLTATLRASDLAATSLRFVVLQTTPAGTVRHDRDGEPFALRADRAAPVARLDAPASSERASFRVSWNATDDVGAAAFRVDVKEGAAAWRTWLHATREADATFTGVPERAYRFRVAATDHAGNVGDWSEERAVGVTRAATADGPNEAPVVAFLAPGEGASFDGDFTARVTASDPDGTTPQVRVCAWREDDVLDVACPHEGEAGSFTVDAAALPDGRYRLHAWATDGNLTTEADSPVFAVQRAAPPLLGASASFEGTRGVLVLGAGPEVASAQAEVADRILTLRDDGTGGDARAGDGAWSAAVRLDPGEYVARFVARSATGREAVAETAFRVDPDPAPPGGGSGTASPPPTTDGPPAGKQRTPGPGLALLALAALAAVALRRRA